MLNDDCYKNEDKNNTDRILIVPTGIYFGDGNYTIDNSGTVEGTNVTVVGKLG